MRPLKYEHFIFIFLGFYFLVIVLSQSFNKDRDYAWFHQKCIYFAVYCCCYYYLIEYVVKMSIQSLTNHILKILWD